MFMSTSKTEKSNVILNGLGGTLPLTMSRVESPQEYVNRVMQQAGMTHRRIADRARALGHKLSAGYVHNIASGLVDNPSIRLVQALAAGLGRPEDEVIAVFRGKQIAGDAAFQNSLFGVMGAEFSTLGPKDQKELRLAIEMLHNEIRRRL